MVELQRQNEQIMRIDTKLNSIDNQADRLKKYINYFARELQADKIMIGLICCVCIFVILIIVGLILPDKSGDERGVFEKLTDDVGITAAANATADASLTNTTVPVRLLL